jgi:hypothetical protein
VTALQHHIDQLPSLTKQASPTAHSHSPTHANAGRDEVQRSPGKTPEPSRPTTPTSPASSG